MCALPQQTRAAPCSWIALGRLRRVRRYRMRYPTPPAEGAFGEELSEQTFGLLDRCVGILPTVWPRRQLLVSLGANTGQEPLPLADLALVATCLDVLLQLIWT